MSERAKRANESAGEDVEIIAASVCDVLEASFVDRRVELITNTVIVREPETLHIDLAGFEPQPILKQKQSRPYGEQNHESYHNDCFHTITWRVTRDLLVFSTQFRSERIRLGDVWTLVFFG